MENTTDIVRIEPVAWRSFLFRWWDVISAGISLVAAWAANVDLIALAGQAVSLALLIGANRYLVELVFVPSAIVYDGKYLHGLPDSPLGDETPLEAIRIRDKGYMTRDLEQSSVFDLRSWKIHSDGEVSVWVIRPLFRQAELEELRRRIQRILSSSRDRIAASA